MTDFTKKIAEILEISADELTMQTDFRKCIDNWDSMKGFAILVLLEDDYNLVLEIAEFLECKTIGDLYGRIAQ